MRNTAAIWTLVTLTLAVMPIGSPAPAQIQEHAPGTTQRHLWTVGDATLAGAISADGRSLSFLDWTAGNIAIRRLSAGETSLLSGNDSWDDITGWAEEAALSRDGRRVAYTWYDRTNDRFELRIADREAPRRPPIAYRPPTGKFWVCPLDWAPDGRRLAAVFRIDRVARLVVVTIGRGDVEGVRVLKTWRGTELPHAARFSPDGTRLAHDLGSHAGDGKRDVFSFALATGDETALVVHPAVDRLVDWTPDGANILFVSDRTGGRGLWMQPVAKGRATGSPRLLKRAFHGGPHGVDRRGRLYYSVSASRRDVMIATLDEDEAGFISPPVEASARFVHHTKAAEWSPDGRSLAYLCGGAGAHRTDASPLVIRDLATGEERRVPASPLFPAGARVRSLRWGPDGKTLRVVARQAAGKRALLAIDVSSGTARRLKLGVGPAGAWSPDGKVFYYWRKWRTIVRLEVGSGTETILHRQTAEGGGLDVSPDGRLIVFRRSADSIVVMPTEGGAVREVYRFPDRRSNEQNTGVRWTPDGKRVLFVRRGRELWSVDVSTETAKRIGSEVPGLKGVSMHPDGRRIAFTTGHSGTALWAMEGFLP